MTIIFLMLQEAVILPGSVQRQCVNHRETQGCNNQFFYILLIKRWRPRAYCKEQQQQRMVDWEHEITPSNNQPNLYVASHERVTIAKQWHFRRNDQFFTSYVVLQKATTMTKFFSVKRKKQRLRLTTTREHVRSPKRQPTSWSMWINHIDDCKGAKRQQ